LFIVPHPPRPRSLAASCFPCQRSTTDFPSLAAGNIRHPPAHRVPFTLVARAVGACPNSLSLQSCRYYMTEIPAFGNLAYFDCFAICSGCHVLSCYNQCSLCFWWTPLLALHVFGGPVLCACAAPDLYYAEPILLLTSPAVAQRSCCRFVTPTWDRLPGRRATLPAPLAASRPLPCSPLGTPGCTANSLCARTLSVAPTPPLPILRYSPPPVARPMLLISLDPPHLPRGSSSLSPYFQES